MNGNMVIVPHCIINGCYETKHGEFVVRFKMLKEDIADNDKQTLRDLWGSGDPVRLAIELPAFEKHLNDV